jgi:hypothetical protein
MLELGDYGEDDLSSVRHFSPDIGIHRPRFQVLDSIAMSKVDGVTQWYFTGKQQVRAIYRPLDGTHTHRPITDAWRCLHRQITHLNHTTSHLTPTHPLQAVLKRHWRHLTLSAVGKAIHHVKARYGALDPDLPALIVRSRGELPQVLNFATLSAHKPAEMLGILGIQVRPGSWINRSHHLRPMDAPQPSLLSTLA